MTEEYKKRLTQLAKEIHQMQLEQSDKLKGKKVGVNFDTLSLNSKINFLVGYILALEE